MPIRIPNDLPARAVLEHERIPTIQEKDAQTQDIRPMEIAILNLMPDKITTETQLMRAIGSTPLQVNMTLLCTASYTGKTTSSEHLKEFYQVFDSVKDKKFDGIIITGAPVAHMAFEDVTYWQELETIMNWTNENVFSTFYICWGALAGLYHYYGIEKNTQEDKFFGLYNHHVEMPYECLVRGFDDYLTVPVSRYSLLNEAQLKSNEDLKVLIRSDELGPCLIQDSKNRRVFMLNHLEYEVDVLDGEFKRDQNAGVNTPPPLNYYKDTTNQILPDMMWRAHRTLLFHNWINIVYQGTPYDLNKIPEYAEKGWQGMRFGSDTGCR